MTSPDNVAATRVISVVASPCEDGSEEWLIEVDYDNWISPWEAFALLKAGMGKLEDRLYERVDGSEE